MKALVKENRAPGLALRDVDMPLVSQPDDVLFRVECCAICVGELRVVAWDAWAQEDPTLEIPTVLGHEASGVVVEVGPGVRRVKPGERITLDPFIHCGQCWQCRSGHTNLCVEREIYGKRRGAFAEYAVLPERVIARLPEGLSPEEGALLENLGVAVHAVELADLVPGDVAVVIGAGPIGILIAQALRAQGATVVLSDLLDWRLELALLTGDFSPVNPTRQDCRQVVADLSEGRGARAVIEAAGTQSSLDQAFDAVGDGGTVVTLGTFRGPVAFNPFFRMTRREVRLVSSIGRTWETWRRMTQLIQAGRIRLGPLISHVLPIEQYEQAFELAGSGRAMKVLLRP